MRSIFFVQQQTWLIFGINDGLEKINKADQMYSKSEHWRNKIKLKYKENARALVQQIESNESWTKVS